MFFNRKPVVVAQKESTQHPHLTKLRARRLAKKSTAVDRPSVMQRHYAKKQFQMNQPQQPSVMDRHRVKKSTFGPQQSVMQRHHTKKMTQINNAPSTYSTFGYPRRMLNQWRLKKLAYKSTPSTVRPVGW